MTTFFFQLRCYSRPSSPQTILLLVPRPGSVLEHTEAPRDACSDCVVCVSADYVSLAYQRVQKVECASPRPVLILGPLVDAVKDMLVKESPGKFCRCVLGKGCQATPLQPAH